MKFSWNGALRHSRAFGGQHIHSLYIWAFMTPLPIHGHALTPLVEALHSIKGRSPENTDCTTGPGRLSLKVG